MAYIDNHNEQKQTLRSQCLDLKKKLNSNLIRKNNNWKIRFANTLGKRHTKKQLSIRQKNIQLLAVVVILLSYKK